MKDLKDLDTYWEMVEDSRDYEPVDKEYYELDIDFTKKGFMPSEVKEYESDFKALEDDLQDLEEWEREVYIDECLEGLLDNVMHYRKFSIRQLFTILGLTG